MDASSSEVSELIVNENKKDYDFDQDLLNHINKVRRYINLIITELADRAKNHDLSKTTNPEHDIYAKFTPLLQGLKYQSKEYKDAVNSPEFKFATDHHDRLNSHHPEYYEDGIDGMDLVDLIEMLCDWKAASERHKNAPWSEGFTKNCERFSISPQLTRILSNTIDRYIMPNKKGVDSNDK